MKTFLPPGRTITPPPAAVAGRLECESPEARRARIERRTFYSSDRWRKVQAVQLARFPLCCWGNHLATMVDHVVPRLDRPDLAYTLSNLRSCCRHCHAVHGRRAKVD